jgi:putative ABC transport system permease protein
MLVPEPMRAAVLGDLEEQWHRAITHPRAATNPRAARRRYWRQALSAAWHLGRLRPQAAAYPRYRRREPMRQLAGDLILAVRALRRSPSYALVAFATLALAIGANTLLFSLANPLVVRPLPIHDTETIGWLQTENPARQIERGRFSQPDLIDLRSRVTSFTAIGGYTLEPATLDGHQTDPERITRLAGTANLTGIWGMTPVIGRTFQPGDDAPGGPQAGVLAHHYWRDRFASDPGVVGRELRLNGRPLVIVGVMPAEIELGNLSLIDVWTPVPLDPDAPRDRRTFTALGRLAPGATVASADAEVSGIAAQWAADHPDTHREWQAHVRTPRAALAPSSTWVILTLLGIVTLFVLLIACANLTNLVLVRLVARRQEIAVRLALGASRWRLIRPMLLEGAVLSAAGGVAGLLLAYGGLRVINAVAFEPFLKTIAIDGNVLIFTALVAALTPALFSAWPALAAGRMSTATTLREQRTSAGHAVRKRRNVLVAGQVALALSLLITSVLAVRSMLYVRNIPMGIDVAHTALFRFELPEDRYPDPEARARAASDLATGLAGTGGVLDAAVVSHLPVFDGEVSRTIGALPQAAPEGRQPWAAWYAVTPAFFDAATMPILTGRGFTEADRAGREPVAILNAWAASRYFASVADALDRHITVADDAGQPRDVRIVGVVSDTRSPALLTTSPQIYVPFAQWPVPAMTGFVRADAPGERLTDLRAAVRALDPQLPVSALQTTAGLVRDELASNNITNGMFIGFALLALVLAAGGLYGVIAYSVGQRSREIGVRLALGAAPGGIRRMVLADGLRVTLAGAAVGLVLAVGLAKVAAPVLEGVSPTDPLTYAGTTLAVLAIALLSILAPAIRAMRTDPARTLRAD